jgi:hypothetical protein
MLERAEHREILMWWRQDPPREAFRLPASGP